MNLPKSSKVAISVFTVVTLGAYGIPYREIEDISILPPTRKDIYDVKETSTFSNYRSNVPFALDIIPSIQIAHAEGGNKSIVISRSFLASLYDSFISIFTKESAPRYQSTSTPILTPILTPIPTPSPVPPTIIYRDNIVTNTVSGISASQVDQKIANAISALPIQTPTIIQQISGGNNAATSPDFFGRQVDVIYNSVGKSISSIQSQFQSEIDAITTCSSIPNVAGGACGNLLLWNGSAWTSVATSSLGISSFSSSDLNSLTCIQVGNGNNACALNASAIGGYNFSGTSGLASVQVGLLNNSCGATLNGSTGAITGTVTATSTIGKLSSTFGICNLNSGDCSSAFGYKNTVSGNGEGSGATASGYENFALGFANSAFGYRNCTMQITCGSVNRATAVGVLNTASGWYTSAVGYGNNACGYDSSAVGLTNIASGNYSSAFGFNNVASASGAAAFGFNNVASASGAVVFGSGITNSTVNSTMMGFSGGWIRVSSGGCLISSTGANLTTGGTWTNNSDRNLKENFTTLDSADVLNKIIALPVTQWNYKVENNDITHIGPTAQDFYSAFHTGGSDKSISTIDPAGVALIGIQALNKKIDKLEKLEEKNNLENASMTTSLISSFFVSIKEFILDKVTAKVGLFDSIETKNIRANQVVTDKLCIKETCVTEDELKRLLGSQNITAQTATIIQTTATTSTEIATTTESIQATSTETVSASSSVQVAPTPIIETPPVVPTPTPEVVTQSTPTPVVETSAPAPAPETIVGATPPTLPAPTESTQ